VLNRVIGLVPKLWANWVALLGTTLTTVSGNAILIIVVVDIVTGANPYVSSAGYLLMPMVFVLGLGLIALGIWLDHRRRRRGGAQSTLTRAYDMVMADRPARRRVYFVVVATVLNVTLISVAAFKGVTYMDSPEFCGQLCHSVMEPEYQAYVRSPHARVSCVDCHIGEGADWFVRSKASGLRQVWATVTGDFSRPIPTPIHHLRPARETCEKCHWPEKFHGVRLLVRHVYRSDAKNTRVTNVVNLNVGGVNKRSGRYEGIHWHVAPDVHIEYEALDPKRRVIGKVMLRQQGKETTYLPPAKAKGGKVFERRVMDCVDCHNRPTHVYDALPERAVDRALALGKLDRSLPYLRREAVALLREKVDPDRAAQLFGSRLKSYYGKQHPEVARGKGEAIEKAGRELGWIYRRNIFPRLKIGWNTYPDHLGHRATTEGCFRCHDDEHKSGKDQVIRQDCDLCHEVLAEEEEKPDVPAGVLRLGKL